MTFDILYFICHITIVRQGHLRSFSSFKMQNSVIKRMNYLHTQNI